MFGRWMILGLGLLAAAGCRENRATAERRELAAESSEEAGKASAAGVWDDLEGRWERRSGGEVTEERGILRLQWAEGLTAARWMGETPQGAWEFEGEARRIDGSDFFFSLTFPVRRDDEHVTWVVGGWGGSVVGISSVDGRDASENETTTLHRFETGRWYALRLRVGPDRIEAWIDEEKVVDLALENRQLGLRPGPIHHCAPFGIGTWQSTGEMRGLRWRPIDAP